jgi:hypothetical protein
MFTMLVASVSVVVASRSSPAWIRFPAGDEPSHSAPKPSRSMPAASSGVTRLALRQTPNPPSRLASLMQSP